MIRKQNVIEAERKSHLSVPSQSVLPRHDVTKKPIKLALISCGLGHINRGVEVSTARWFEALKKDQSIDVRLFSGGEYPGATKINNIPRDNLLKTIFSPIANFNSQRIW